MHGEELPPSGQVAFRHRLPSLGQRCHHQGGLRFAVGQHPIDHLLLMAQGG